MDLGDPDRPVHPVGYQNYVIMEELIYRHNFRSGSIRGRNPFYRKGEKIGCKKAGNIPAFAIYN